MLSILLTALFTYINVPVTDMRSEASQETKVASQAYYSEPIELVEEKNDWIKIQTPDGYQGWAKRNVIFQSAEKYPRANATVVKVNRLAAHVFNVDDTEWGPIITLPYDSRLEIVDQLNGPDGRWLKVRLVDGTIAFIQRGDISFNLNPITHDEMIALSHQFMGLPYTWGGRSSFGYDCSGFMQMLHRQMGIAIPRDSRNQVAWDGFKEVPLDKMEAGDLIFFGREVPKINHVGMYLGKGKFIHAAVTENKPYIHISDMNDSDWNGTGTFKNRHARRLK